MYEKRSTTTRQRFRNCNSKHIWEQLFDEREVCCCTKIDHTCEDFVRFLSTLTECDCERCCIFLDCNCEFCTKYKSTRKPKTLCKHISCDLRHNGERLEIRSELSDHSSNPPGLGSVLTITTDNDNVYTQRGTVGKCIIDDTGTRQSNMDTGAVPITNEDVDVVSIEEGKTDSKGQPDSKEHADGDSSERSLPRTKPLLPALSQGGEGEEDKDEQRNGQDVDEVSGKGKKDGKGSYLMILLNDVKKIKADMMKDVEKMSHEFIDSHGKIPGLARKIKTILLKDHWHPNTRAKDIYLWEKCEAAVAAGTLKRKQSPCKNFYVYNYTSEVVLKPENWDETTLCARATVFLVDPDYYEGTAPYPAYVELVTTTFPKFFNKDEDIPLSYILKHTDPKKWEITTKLDGSLGTIFFNEKTLTWQCITKGSFDSPQALYANRQLKNMNLSSRTCKKGPSLLTIGETYHVEIVTKKNKHTIGYGDYEGLVLIGAYKNPHAQRSQIWLGNKENQEYSYEELYNLYDDQIESPFMFKIVDRHYMTTMEEVEGFVQSTKGEGLVFKYYLGNSCHRFKMKSPYYLERTGYLNKTKQGLTRRNIYSAFIKSDEDAKKLREVLWKREDLDFFDETIQDFEDQIYHLLWTVRVQLQNIKTRYGRLSVKTIVNSFKEYDYWCLSGVGLTSYEKDLLLKAYTEGLENFETSWVQKESCRPSNRNREILFKHLQVSGKKVEWPAMPSLVEESDV